MGGDGVSDVSVGAGEWDRSYIGVYYKVGSQWGFSEGDRRGFGKVVLG